ncbi:E3 ubiquitin-protein ligase TRIM33-like [Acanthaster planci]|uniref:E3 ubiquitin-protein ligase TRIM33-like n=1 Tax=Acanthaster planci TaxID=133434 RepID=A0A8B7XPA4_ACAPL|nr:E3 ubiquitin-protein ligase TRIM33-like [Acanthaster planci]
MEQSDTPTPEAKTPELAKEKEEPQKPAEEDWSFGTVCKVCNGDLLTREPKLMPCLHTVCKQCVLNVTNAEKQGCRCPICRQDCRNINEIIDNYFITGGASATSAESSVKDAGVCLCDDQSEVSAFCQDCMEWLCEPCVQAHQRVRVTKDHVIKPRSEVAGTSGEGSNGSGRNEQKPLFCSVHRQEQLKLYCETCEKLTCRDCQLQEHKEHKYQFVGEIATRQKSALRILLGKLGEKQNYVQQTKKHILSKGEQLQTNEEQVTQEIRNLVFRLVNDITQRGKKLLSDLKGVCDARRKMFDQQILEVHRVEQAIEHAVDFTKRALHSDNITALLYSQKVIVHQLVFLLRIMCTRQPIAGLDIKFLANMQNLPNFSQLWTLVVHDPLQAGNSGVGPPTAAPSGSHLPGPHPQGGQVPPELLVGGRMRSPGSRPLSAQELQQKINLQQLMNRRQNSLEANHHSPQGRPGEPPHPAFQQPQGGPPPLSIGPHPQRLPNQATYRIFPKSPSAMAFRPAPPQKYNYPPPNITINQMSKQMLSQVGINTAETIPNIPPILPPRSSTEQSVSLSRSNTPSSPLLVSPASSGDEQAQGNGARIKGEGSNSREGRASCSVVDGQRRNNNFSLMVPFIFSSLDLTDSHQTVLKDESSRSSCMMGNDTPVKIKQEPGIQDSEEYPQQSHLNDCQENGGKHMSPRGHNSDPNEDWCAVCHNGGDLLCCDSCPRVYHLYCHIPSLSVTPSDSWVCTLCQSPDNIANPRSQSPSNSGRKRRISSALPEREKMLCEKILLEVYCSEDSIPFHEPVSRSVPNYHKIIQHPMELSTIRSRLQTSHFNHYQTILEFVDDFKLMIRNCHVYNGEESEIGRTATALDRSFNELMGRHLPDYTHLLERVEDNSPLTMPARPASSGEDGERRRKRKPDKVYHHIATPPPMHIK